jgi:phage terminase large subunit
MKKQIVIDFNPNCSPEHWVYAKMISRKDAVLLRSTFKDNPYCPDDIEKEIAGYEPTPENISAGTADAMLWRIYGLGERGVVTGLVFPIIELVSESKMPLTFERQAYGIDFGFSNDATAIVFCGVCNGCLYMREIVYDRGLSIIRNELGTTVKSIQDKLEQANVDRNLKFWCDSVEPRSIEDLKSVGYNAESVKKGSGSIMRGIEIMKRYKIYVQDDSYNLIRELRNYKWKQNADGAFTNEIVGGMDHAIDAARYALLMMMENSGKTYIDSVKMDYGESRYAY